MNAQQMLLDYAARNNSTKLTDQQFIGQAIVEGIKIYRDHQDVIVRVSRTGQTITLTETVKTPKVINGQYTVEENTTEVLQVNV
jgi:hypothetical protein